MLDSLEIEEIKSHNSLAPNGYNLDSGGSGSHNRTVSVETRQKMSNAQRARPDAKDAKCLLLEHLKGNQFRLGKSPSNKGIPLTQEEKRRISIAKKGKPNIKKRHPDREKARELFDSLSMSITEKRKIIHQTFPHINYKTIWRWTTLWNK